MDIKEILARWNDYEESPFRRKMLQGISYFAGHNDIEKPENGRYDTSLDPKNLDRVQSTKMSDRRISNNFFKFIINQQLAYGVARRFILTKSNVEAIEEKGIVEWIKSKILKFPTNREKLEKRFNAFNILVSKTFQERYVAFLDTCANAPKQQIGWVYIYYNENNELEFLSMNPTELCPVWKDDKQIEVTDMIRKYTKIEYIEGERHEVPYLEHYLDKGIEIYKYEGENTDEPVFQEFKPYFVYTNGAYGEFPFIPFIPIRYNSENLSLLDDIKNQIDAYDKLVSELCNNVIDIPNAILAVKGLDTTNEEEVAAFIKNVKNHRVMGVPEEGGVEGVTTEHDIEKQISLINSIRKDIFTLGGGIDTSEKTLHDTSGVALQWSYSNIEEKFNIFSNQINIGIRQIIKIILFDNYLQGGEDFTDVDYDIIYDTDSIINETETINNLVMSKGLISPETIAANHPYTKNTEFELNGMKEQMKFAAEINAKDTTESYNKKEKETGVRL